MQRGITLFAVLAVGWVLTTSRPFSTALAEDKRTGAVREDVGQVKPPAVPAISDRMRHYIASKEIAGAVTLVATPNRVVHLNATGHAALDPAEEMRTDSIFWIASMSKPILATLLLMLQDEGRLSVDDPVEKYLPEFKDLKTADGNPARLTIRHLLTHTSGMAEITATQARDCKTLTDVIPLYVAKPVGFAPGSKWAYCQSGINTAGRVAEVVTGEPLDKLLKRRLFDPLGMKDTTFYLTEQQLPRLVKSYRRTATGELEQTAIRFLNGKSPTSRDRFPAPNGGLFSTALDYARFCQMVLRGGELDGKRYLKPETVKFMTTIQTGDLKTGFTPGNGWGLGWCVVREPQGITAMLSPGAFGHGGAYGTQAWIDPGAKRVYILMVQRANFPNSDASEVRKGFQEAASGAFAASFASDKKAKILLIGKDLDHARNTHTYMSDCTLLAKCLRQTDGVEAVVSNGWPKDPAVVQGVTAIVLHTRLGGTVLFRGPQRRQVEELLKQGVGITAIHWGTGAETPEGGPWLQAMGGWFNAEGDGFSRYLVQSSKLRQANPQHPICRGWGDFDLREEFYFKICFLPEAQPIMSTVIEGKEYPIGWVYERRNPKAGRSFSFVGGHFHDNFGIREFRQAVVNGILWTAHVDIPEKGAPISLAAKDMELPPEQPKKK